MLKTNTMTRTLRDSPGIGRVGVWLQWRVDGYHTRVEPWVSKDLCSCWIQSDPTKHKTARETMTCLQKFVTPDQKPDIIHTDFSLEFILACEDMCGNDDKSTPRRSETKRIAEHAVRREKECTVFVKTCVGITTSHTHADQKPTEVLRSHSVRYKKTTSTLLVQSGLKKEVERSNGFFCYLRNKTHWQTKSHLMQEILALHLMVL